MRTFRQTASLLVGTLVFSTIILPTQGVAGLFPDVTDAHPFKGEIESLVRSGVLHGNPNGEFRPDRELNRAEFLKMLYLAKGLTPKPIYSGCFSDVERGSWYESYVCDASSKERNFVQGYSDSKFRPASPVTRTEALKMLFSVLNLPVSDVTNTDRDLVKFVDVSVAAWYTKYLAAAYGLGVLPIAGQSGSRFYPDQPLTRGEAAAYIFNGMRSLTQSRSSASSSTTMSSSSVTSSASNSSSVASSSASAASSSPTMVTKSVNFPFSDSDRFSARSPLVYLFSLTQPRTAVSIAVNITGYYQSEVTCRLYLMTEDGFPDEYYLGIQEKGVCTIVAALKPGNYQLQLQPSAASPFFTVTAGAITGDGNDGFLDAVFLKQGTPRTAVVEAGDMVDWYMVTLENNREGTIEFSSNGEKLLCTIYPPKSFDQFGFSSPKCNQVVQFQASDEPYYIGISRAAGPLNNRATYIIKWK